MTRFSRAVSTTSTDKVSRPLIASTRCICVNKRTSRRKLPHEVLSGIQALPSRSEVIMTLLASSAAAVSFLRNHRFTAVAVFVLVLAAVQLHSLWNKYWEITPDARLLSRAYGFKLSFPPRPFFMLALFGKSLDFPFPKKILSWNWRDLQ